MTEQELFEKIKEAINKRISINNKYDDTYVRRLQCYPEFLQMPYWFTHGEYVDFLSYIKEINFSGKILDFGCGSGHMDIILARHGYVIKGIDLSPMAIDICNILRENEDDLVKSKVSFSLEDISEESTDGEIYDLVWASHVMEHILDPEPIFKGLRSRVAPGTKMRVSVPLGYAFNDPDHVHHWANREEFESFFGKYINVENVDIKEKHGTIVGYFSF